MVGEEEEEESPRSYSEKSVWRRISVLLAGPLMNFILALVIFAVLFLKTGVITTKIESVADGMPASEAGLMAGDIIKSIDGKPVNKWNEVPDYVSESKGEPMTIVALRGEETKSFEVKAILDKESSRYLVGITASMEKSAGRVIGASIDRTLDIAKQTLLFFPQLFTKPELFEQVSGPVGIATIIGDVSEHGFWPLLALTAIISINLGVFNLLPIVPLDGGKIFLCLIEAIIRKKLNPKFEMVFSVIGIGLVLCLFVFVMYNDIARLVT